MNLINQQKTLADIIAKAKRILANSPEDTLQISSSHNKVQFCIVHKDGNRTYLPKSNNQVLKTLGKKYYAQRVLKHALTMKARIDHFLKFYRFQEVLDVFDNLPTELKDLIVPFAISDKQFAEKWAEEDYETKGINDGERFYTTENGEKVRSKSELTIANKLFIKDIKYRYEQAHYMKGFGTIYPDFTILNAQTREEIIWEHFGLMDNPEYVRTCLKKLQTYADNGIFPGHGLIVTYESETVPLDTNTLDAIIQTLKS